MSKKYHVYLVDIEPQVVEIDAESTFDARAKTERMLRDGTLWENVRSELTEACYEVQSVEEAH